jgi:hypothetical protein
LAILLTRTYNTRNEFSCLPFLPSEHIRPTFEAMIEFNNSESIEPLLTYIDRHWFNSPVWSVEEWCVYGQAVRTNNDVEGKDFKHKTENLYSIIYKIQLYI